MAEQVKLISLFGAEPSRHALRRGVFLVDAVDDAVEFEGRKTPIDRCPRGLHRIALAAKLAGDAPADFKTRPARREPRADTADEFAAGFFLDHEHAEAMQGPMPGHDRRVAPSRQLGGDRL